MISRRTFLKLASMAAAVPLLPRSVRDRAQFHVQTAGVPVGYLHAWMGDHVPRGWMLSEGQMLDVIDYPELYEAIGFTYGSGYGPQTATGFRLPDLRERVKSIRESRPEERVPIPGHDHFAHIRYIIWTGK